MKPRMLLAVLVASTVVTAFAGETFYWQQRIDRFFDFTDPANWGLSSDGTVKTDGRVPGEDDFIWNGCTSARAVGSYVAVGSFDLGGVTNTIYGYSGGTDGAKWGSGSGTWKNWYVFLTNGTLIVRNPRMNASGSDLNVGHIYTIYAGANLVYPDLEGATYGAFNPGNLTERWDIKRGGRGEMYGYLAFRSTASVEGGVTVDEGAEFVFDPQGVWIPSANASCVTFENHGTFSAPRGFKLTNSGSTSSGTDKLYLKQVAGTMRLGGDFTKLAKSNNIKADMRFLLSGGTLEITNSVSFYNDPRGDNTSNGFYNEVSAEMTAGADAAVDVKGGSSADLRLFTYGTGAKLVKRGPGKAILGNRPQTLNVVEGAVFFADAVTELAGVSFAEGTTLGFQKPGNALESLPDAEKMTFALADDFPAGEVVLASSDADLLETVAENLTLPAALADCEKVISGGKLRLMKPEDNVFVSDGEVDLGNPDNWSGWLPKGGVARLTGDATIGVISSSTPAFSSIAVSGGATLKVATDVSLPPIALTQDARILIASGTSVRLANGLDCVATETALPVFEIATNATLTVPGATEFKNVDLRHYGLIDVLPGTSSADSYIAFGTAKNGETTYFAMTSVGGTLHMTKECDKAQRFVHPDAGGKVKVVRPILLKDYVHDMDGSLIANGPWFGVNNPTSLPFDVIVDGSDMEIVRTAFCNGGARVRFVNGSRYVKLASTPGSSVNFLIQDDGRVRFESGSGLVYSRCANPLSVTPSAAGTPSVTVGDGGYFAAHAVVGNGKATFVASNGCWCVDSLPTFGSSPRPPEDDARNWVSNAFSGFASVKIEPGSVLYLKSDNVFDMTQWDRYTEISDIPMTGEGGLVVTNGVPGYGFAATMVSGANTATGRLSVAASVDPTVLYFNDGANWAGTVQGDERISFTNLVDAASPAEVRFASLDLCGKLRVRFWSDGNGQIANDRVNLSAALTGTGCISPVRMSGKIRPGETLWLGDYPASAGVPDAGFADRNWKIVVESTDDSEVMRLGCRYDPAGTAILVR